MARRLSPRALLAAFLLVFLAVAVPPFLNVNRYRKSVAESIGRALGREVSVSNIELKLLPRPGLVLSNFVVAEDPSYGAEPMLRAETVTALLRLTSLWRGRLEIGRLELDNPSLNLVRRSDGHWNLEELIERSSQATSAPTSKARPEARPRFPYVAASTGRINFKLGRVKKAFSFTDADFALWKESEEQWGVRLEARPMRTDVGISDTGTLKVDGRFQPASELRNTPVSLQVTFTNGPLGQMTKLIYGTDRGWRGMIGASAVIAGTPASLGITFDGQVTDFRRYDIALGEALRMRVHCTATYSSPEDVLRDVNCESPIGQGVFRVHGDAQGWLGGAYSLDVSGTGVPADRVIAFARHAKKDLPADLTATGTVEAALTVHKTAATPPVWQGGGKTSHVALRSNVLQTDLELGEVQFVIPSDNSPAVPRKRSARAKPGLPPVTSGLRVLVKPFPLALGAASPATVSASFDRERYDVRLSGDAELARLLNVARALGIGTPGIGLAGLAQLNLDLAGSWAGFVPPSPSGTVQMKNATAELQGINEPLHIASATATLSEQVLHLTSFAAAFAQGPEINGSAGFPVHCTTPETCVVNFDAHINETSIARLNELANPNSRRQPWYRLLAPWQQRNDALMKVRAKGRFAIARLELGMVLATNVTGSVELQAAQMRVRELHAELLGGKQAGVWTADFSVSPPSFAGEGTVSKLSMAQLAAVMHDNWATGTIDARYSLTMSGLSAAALRNSAGGSADFSWNAGSLRHLILEERGTPVTFSELAGKLALQNGVFTATDCTLQAPGGSYALKGTASFDRNLDLRLERSGGRSYAVSGTLEKPVVVSAPARPAEASLQ